MNPSSGVSANVSFVVDATNAEDIEASIDQIENFFDDHWNIDLNSVFITSTPTARPSTSPSMAPTTLQPSAKPSITGLVITIDVTFFCFYFVPKISI